MAKQLSIVLVFLAAAPSVVLAQADPPQDKLKVTGQVRTRAEHLDEFDLNETATTYNADGQRLFLRTRLKLEATPTSDVKTVVMFQDSRVYGGEATTAANLGNIDLHLAYVQVGDLTKQKLSLQAGRMELSYGNQRLLGAFAWHNVARSFDAVRVRAKPNAKLQIDGFWARLHDRRTEVRALGDDLMGVYAMFKQPKLAIDAYGIYLRDRGGRVDTNGDGMTDADRFPGGGKFHLATAGARLDGTFGDVVHINAEAAVQFGKRGNDVDVFAYAGHAAVDYLVPSAYKPTLGVGANVASGDSDPSDSKWETFENLFPTNHLHYGYIDMAAWKNLVDIYGVVTAKPTKRVFVRAAVRMLQRLSADDTFYRASQAPLRDSTVALTTDARDVGTEIDLLLKWQLRPTLGLLAGFSYLLAGDFLKDTGGGDAPNPAFGYMQLVANF